MQQLVARYNVTPDQHQDGGSPEVQADGYGRLIVVTDSSSPPTFSDPALEALVTQSNFYLNDIDGNTFTIKVQQTDTSQISQVYSGAKGASAITAVTSTANGADHQGLDVVEQFMSTSEDNVNGVYATVNKPLSVSTYTPTLYANFAGSVTGAAIKASAGNLFTIVATNANAAVRYLQLFNATAKPAGASVPIMSFPIPVSGGSVQLGSQFFTSNGINFATGITWCVSTTVATFTDSATASEHTIHATYL